jgi:hypothetical protein
LIQSCFCTISLSCLAIVVLFRKLLPMPIFQCICYYFYGCFKVSGLVLIHFELIFVQSERQGSHFSLLYVYIHFSQPHLSGGFYILHHVLWTKKSVDYRYMDLCLVLLFHCLDLLFYSCLFSCQYHGAFIFITL